MARRAVGSTASGRCNCRYNSCYKFCCLDDMLMELVEEAKLTRTICILYYDIRQMYQVFLGRTSHLYFGGHRITL
jgi:hypothetical protein